MSAKKPNIFIVLGMPRTGTTFLYHTLQNHPDVYLPYRKESYYFSVNFHKGEDWFKSLYDDMPANQVGADIGPVYFLDPLSIDRILEFEPNIKVLLGVREPVSYAISQYSNIQALGAAMPPLIEWVSNYKWDLSPKASIDVCLENSFISKRIEELRRIFNDNLLIYDFKLIGESPLAVLKSIESFLDIKPHFDEDNFDNVKINASGRRNIRLLNYFLTNQRILDVIYKVTPKKAIRLFRGMYDKLSVKGEPQKTDFPSEDERKFLQEFFAGDQEYLDKLFSSNRIQLGSGQPICS
ncbi:sulfotransferase [Vicingaceae bacterium]|nr:sulfotransferase [Vicingaceae bacterium]